MTKEDFSLAAFAVVSMAMGFIFGALIFYSPVETIFEGPTLDGRISTLEHKVALFTEQAGLKQVKQVQENIRHLKRLR